MSKRTLCKIAILIIAVLINVYVICAVKFVKTDELIMRVQYEMTAEKTGVVFEEGVSETPISLQTYFDQGVQDFSEYDSVTVVYNIGSGKKNIEFPITLGNNRIRFDFGEIATDITLSNIKYVCFNKKYDISVNDLVAKGEFNGIKDYEVTGDSLVLHTEDGDPFIIYNSEDFSIIDDVARRATTLDWIAKILICLAFDFIVVLIVINKGGYLTLMKDIKDNGKMMFGLAKNDFRQKYAASNFGILWAFVQPLVTIMIYVFVFQVGFKAGGTENGYHYVLYLLSGIVPWFFFAEAWMNSTNCLIEYSYLVKKIVFKIDVLPVVKMLSSLFIHLFFVAVTIIVFICNKKLPTPYYFQIFYYMICNICLVVSVSYFTAAITPFFPDFSQIVNIITQVGMWTVPIMWQETMISPNSRWILKLNPVYYIVSGYRDCFIYRVGFWEKPELFVYFWTVTMILFVIGYRMFKKLKVHFADVL